MYHHRGVARKSPHMVAEPSCGSAEPSIEGRIFERICEQIGTVQEKTYSLLQQSSFVGLELSTHLARSEVSTMIRRLATQEHYVVLAQLASLISEILKFGAGNCENPLMRVNTLITELISWLQDGASSETQKACSDEETSKATAKEDLEDDTAKRSSTLETAVSRSTLDSEDSSRDRTLQCTAEQILDVPVPETMKQLLEKPETTSVDRVQQQTVKHIVGIPVPQVMEELVEFSKVFPLDRVNRVWQTRPSKPLLFHSLRRSLRCQSLNCEKRRNRL